MAPRGSEEWRENLRAGLRAFWSSPAGQAKRSTARRPDVSAVWADPVQRAARIAAMKSGMAAAHARKARVVVPGWVPRCLVDEYVETAIADGEESAASRVRLLKRELRP